MADKLATFCAPSEPQQVPGFRNFGHIPLRGVTNARDLGGLPAADHKRIARRRLVRSSSLHDATAEDMKQLLHMHAVDCVIDLRTDVEAEKEPDPKPLMRGVKYMHLPVFTQEAIGITSGGNPVRDMRAMMEYAGKPYEMISELYVKSVLGEPGKAAYTAFLEDLLAETSGATLWHCTQGKDRTGIAAVLVEYILGVPVQYIRDDYLATNLFVGGWAETMRKFLADKKFGRTIDEDVNAYAFANLCYLDAMVEAIEGAYGSLDNYIVRALGFDADKQRKLRELYLV